MRFALALFTVGVALLTIPAHTERDRPRAAEGYAERVVGAGLLELPPALGEGVSSVVMNGRRRALVTPLDVAVALPGALAVRVFGAGEATGGTLRSGAAMLAPIILLASIGGVFFARLRRRSGLALALGPALGTTLGLLFCTSLLLAVRRADAILLATLSLLLMLDLLSDPPKLGGTRHFVQLGLVAATLVLAEAAFEGVALALVLVDLLRRREGLSLRGVAVPMLAVSALLPLALSAVAVRLWAAQVALSPQPSGATMHALYGLLLSPGRSLFLYSPLALAGLLGFSRLWRRDRGRAEAIAIAVLLGLLGVSGRADWHGDPAFGPTLVVPLLPLLVEPAALLLAVRERAGRVVFLMATTAGLIVQLLALSVDVEAWPRLVAEVRVATGAPGWFLEPAADIEFIPQLSPLVGQATLLRGALRGALPLEPPFLLVVGSDQADPGKPAGLTAWQEVSSRFDRARLRPNLVIGSAAPGAARVLLGLSLALVGAGFAGMIRARKRRG